MYPVMIIVVILPVLVWQGTQNFGGIRVGNGPTEDEAEIIQHDQLSQQYDEEPEVTANNFSPTLTSDS